MIKHIVMWRLKDQFENGDRHNIAQHMKLLLEELSSHIAEIKLIEVGINCADNQDAADVVLYSEFETLADLHSYQQHPAHLKVAEFVKKVRVERRIVDYET